MKKYRMFYATFTRVVKTMYGFEYEVITKSDDENVDYQYGEVFETLQQANDCPDATVLKRPKVMEEVITRGNWFHSMSEANRWLNDCKEEFADDLTGTTVREITLDRDELDDLEYSPTFDVELEVIVTKRINVTIDSSEYDDIDDGYDAGEKARELWEDGELTDEFDEAPEFDTDCSVLDVDEE